MASIDFSSTILLTVTNPYVFTLASPEFLINQEYDLPVNYSFDLNIDSTDASGEIRIYLQNTSPISTDYLQTPKIIIPISGGTFSGSATKYTVDNNGVTSTNYMMILYIRNSGSGTINLIGQKTFK